MDRNQLNEAFQKLETAIEEELIRFFDDDLSLNAEPEMTVRFRKLVRALAIMEQVFGGISRRLWDDPFEWTLPESTFSREAAITYLQEVRQLRKETMLAIRSDEELDKLIPAPNEMKQLGDILYDALRRAEKLIYSP
jgi:hypothetical protein